MEIVQLDPLSEYCEVLMRNKGFDVPHKMITADAEYLRHAVRNEKRFHLIYSSNAIDHCRNPPNVLYEIGQLAREHRAAIYLDHYVDVGELNKYHGVHQWNFCVSNNGHRYILWDRLGHGIDVASYLKREDFQTYKHFDFKGRPVVAFYAHAEG